LTIAPPAVYARRSIFIPIENPIITVLARERQGDGDRTMVPVYAVVVGVPVDLVGGQMMRVCRTAARSFHPSGDRGAVCPLVVSACRDSGQRSEDRNQTPHVRFPRYAFSNLTPPTSSPGDNQETPDLRLPFRRRSSRRHSPTLRIRRSPASQVKASTRVEPDHRRPHGGPPSTASGTMRAHQTPISAPAIEFHGLWSWLNMSFL
jgi:hypothetical protein